MLAVPASDYILPGVSLVSGAALALGGGLVLEHLRYRKRRRVAARSLFDVALAQIGGIDADCKVRDRDTEPRPPDPDTDDFRLFGHSCGSLSAPR